MEFLDLFQQAIDKNNRAIQIITQGVEVVRKTYIEGRDFVFEQKEKLLDKVREITDWYDQQIGLELSKQDPNFAKIYAAAVAQGLLDIVERDELRSLFMLCATAGWGAGASTAAAADKATWLTQMIGKNGAIAHLVDMRTRYGRNLKIAADFAQQAIAEFGQEKALKMVEEKFGQGLARDLEVLFDLLG